MREHIVGASFSVHQRFEWEHKSTNQYGNSQHSGVLDCISRELNLTPYIMATSIIKTDSSNAPIVGVADTTIATANRDNLSNLLVRTGNVVHMDLSILFNTAVPSGNFALLPVGFRPKENVSIPCTWRNSSGTVLPHRAILKPSGYIEQNVGNNMSHISISGTYTI